MRKTDLAIFLHHGLGDVLMALPALWAADAALEEGGRIDVVVKSKLEAGILSGIEWQGQIRILTLPSGSRSRRVWNTLRIATALRSCRPQALVTPHMTSGAVAEVSAWLVGAPLSVIPCKAGMAPSPHRLAPEFAEHKARYYARYFAAAGLAVDPDALVWPPLQAAGLSSAVPRILLAPAVGARSEQHKAWPLENFSELANRLLQITRPLTIELTGAPLERPILHRVLQGIKPSLRDSVQIVTAPGPQEAAQGMTGAAAIVTACSGASHLAAWADVPIVGLFGPTNPCFTGPFSKKRYLVRKGYACSPCYRAEFTGGCGTPVCMTDITTEDVLDQVVAVLNGASPSAVPDLGTVLANAPDTQLIPVVTAAT